MKSITKKLFYGFAIIGATTLTSCSSNNPTKEDFAVSETSSESSNESNVVNAEVGNAILTDATKCAMCHKLSEEKLIGPGLKGVTKRRTDEWLTGMIKDPVNFVQTDADAKKLFEEYNKIPMTHIDLSDADIANIIAYLKQNDAN